MKKRYNLDLLKIKTMLQEDKSINFIANHFGVDWITIRARIYDNPELLTKDKK